MKILEAGRAVRVYRVGSSVPNRAALDRFLADRGFVEYKQDAVNHADELIETAGRVCYMSFGEGRRKALGELSQSERYLNHIIDVGHGSVAEHPVYNFIITGIDRNLTHELVRHRVGVAYSQLSSRYVDLTNYAVIVPVAIRQHPDLFRKWTRAVTACMESYTASVEVFEAMGMEKKVAREDAMSILPGSIETIMFASFNVRALRHIFHMRGALGAKKDIRAMAVALWKEVSSAHAFTGITLMVDPTHGEYLVNSKPKF